MILLKNQPSYSFLMNSFILKKPQDIVKDLEQSIKTNLKEAEENEV